MIATVLVLMHVPIKNESALGQKEELSRAFKRCDLDLLFDRIVPRADTPYSPVDLDLCFSFVEVKKIQSRARSGGPPPLFQKRYDGRLNVTLSIDVSPELYNAFNNAMTRVRALEVRNANKLRPP